MKSLVISENKQQQPIKLPSVPRLFSSPLACPPIGGMQADPDMSTTSHHHHLTLVGLTWDSKPLFPNRGIISNRRLIRITYWDFTEDK